jgi:hypothetical protein
LVAYFSEKNKGREARMKMKLRILSFIAGIVFSSMCYANWFADIVDRIEKTNGIDMSILDRQNDLINIQKGVLSSQKTIESLMREVNHGIVGNSGWGTYQSHDYQSYGGSAGDWSNVMHMAENGQGDGYLGQMMGGLSHQFPADRNTFNRGVTDLNSQRYYALKSQTILAARAASQLDYNKVQDQIAYQQMLQQQIEKTKDLKAAVDLNNRIQVEGNLISLEILRQTALTNQQQAITEQAAVNSALSNARFLTKQ